MANGDQILYRGGGINDLNQNELHTNTVTGVEYDCWWSSDPTTEDEVTDYMMRNPEDVIDVAEHRKVPITGGFSHNLGTSIHFSQVGGDVGAVIFLDRSQIPEELTEIKYDLEWADEHPGTMAHIDQLLTGEIRAEDSEKLIAAVDDDVIMDWGRDRIRPKMESFAGSDEAELVHFGSMVDINPGIVGIGAYYHDTNARGGNFRSVLADLDGYTRTRSYRDDVQSVEYMNDKEVVEALHGEISSRMRERGNQLVTVIYDDARGVDKNERGIPRDEFRYAYDGNRFLKYEEVPMYVGQDVVHNP